MALSRRDLRQIDSKLDDHERAAFAMLNKSLVYEATEKPLDGTPLYVHLFGSTCPISLNITATPELTKWFKTMQSGGEVGKGVGSLVSIPSVERLHSSILVPISTEIGDYGRFPSLSLPCSEPVLRLRFWCAEAIPLPYVSTTAQSIYITPFMVDAIRVALLQVYGAHTIDTIDRILTIRRRLHNIGERVVKYASSSVHSWGALYKKLPPLFTLMPHNSVHHVSVTRGAKDPDPVLLADLNLLATLISASKE